MFFLLNKTKEKKKKRMEIIRIVSAFVLASVCTSIRAQIDGSDYENCIVVSSLMQNIFSQRNVHLNFIPGTLYDAKGNISSATLGLNNFKTRILSLDPDYIRKRLYIFDSNTAAIYAINNFDWVSSFTNMTVTVIHDGLSRYTARIAVDWVSNNIYWTDPLFGWIVVQSGSKTNTYKILIQDALEKPYALAVDPVHKYIFWSDVGSTQKIERATLSGDDRRAIISTGLAFPTSIAVDYSSEKIVWVDSNRDSIETAYFDGTGRMVIRRLSHYEFYDVAVFRDLVSVTDLKNGTLVIINKNTGDIFNTLRKTNGEPFVAVALYGADVQPSQEDSCKSSACSDLCVNGNEGPKCLCTEGYSLTADELTCVEDLGKFHRALMWSNRSAICMTDIRSLTSNGHTDSASCFFSGGTDISHFDIDMIERKVIFADGTDIFSANIGQNPVKQRLLSATGEITGLAVDWRDQNVYWSMGTTDGEINLISQTTLEDYTLIDADLQYPKYLNIIPLNNMMLWISGSTGAYKVEKSELDGSDRVVLISSGALINPKGLTADFATNVLYFIDGGYVKSFDMDSKVLTTLTPESPLNSPQMVLIYKNYLVVADSSYPSGVIKTYEKKSEPVLKFQLTTINVDSMTDMNILDAYLQPDIKGPCDTLNGDCEQICIPIGQNRICQCEYGFQLDSNRESCSSSPVTDNFLLVTDWTHNKIYQISLASDDVRAVDTETYGSPIGVAYNHMTQQLMWSTNKYIHRLNLNGTGYKVIQNTELIGCHADRLVIDFTSGNIYYTANRVSLGGFIGIGVISPDGLHKRLITYGNKPRDIVLDSEDGFLFWTDHGQSPSFIQRANMDGSNIRTIRNSNLVWPNGLAIDAKGNLLYATDGSTDIIYRCTYSGVCTTFYTDTGAHLMDIILLGDYLYYTAWNRPYVARLNRTSPGIITRVGYKPELGRLDSLSAYSSTKTSTTVSDACLPNSGRGPCSTFCLPTPSGYTCSCEDGFNLLSDGKTCENVSDACLPNSGRGPCSTFCLPTPLGYTCSCEDGLNLLSDGKTCENATPTTTTTSSTTPAIHTHTSTKGTVGGALKEPGVPVAVIGGVAAGFVVLIVIIVVLVLVLLKRRNKTLRENNSNHLVQQPETTTLADLPFTTNASGRPDSTYDLIRFDDLEIQTETTTEEIDTSGRMSGDRNLQEENGYITPIDRDQAVSGQTEVTNPFYTDNLAFLCPRREAYSF
ncbi:low-density lipoprotein receptor-related protein 4-like [Mercenaria mercenaria]|uniref:low-density lipoprotein receptor-related protein 4-like n=1 Tax=Mercenaria mercenaria TaxID=6596 RepID=UPI00234EBFA9|nr:low-density lipoprotein receptor-related protein 4-like [Mercenaria mercenaria]